VHLVRLLLFGLLYQPQMMDDGRGAVGGMSGKGNRTARREPAPVPHCPPQIPHDLTCARTQVVAAVTLVLTACATTRPYIFFFFFLY
jgi:hypothetical protein